MSTLPTEKASMEKKVFLLSTLPTYPRSLDIFELKFVPKSLFSYFWILLVNNWRERAAFQRSAFGRSTAGNDVVATKNVILFFSSFLRHDLFS